MPTAKQLMIDGNGKTGEFMGTVAGRWLLRPPGGGKEWEVQPGTARGLTPEEERRLRSNDTDAEGEPEYDFADQISAE
ncbi:hypothetical protein [Streptomyces sp. C]|uniref:hypothetical protein n=1 Tax=Streptomyces sp. C TaxID=253839 RepID=UPI0001B536A9|nr:hypothetical protein [Streptomyces sp. C]EFL15290.1 predicted protein [Streptomyces sp. C]